MSSENGVDDNLDWVKNKINQVEEGLKIPTVEEKEKIDAIRSQCFFFIADKKRYKATELLADSIMKERKLYTTRDDEKPEVWVYEGGIYVPKGKSFIKEFCRGVLGEVYSTHIANDVINKIMADTFIDQDSFFSNNIIEEVVVKNGILNILTGELFPFNHKKIFFNKLPVKFDKTKKCPNIIKHFQEVTRNKEDLPLIQELFGYLLFKEYRFERAFMFTGTGRNGKSKTIELMKLFLGGDNCANISIEQLEKDVYAKSELINRMANLAGDIGSTTISNSASFKSLTGRDLIGAQRKFLTMIHFTNYAKLIFSANEIPKTKDTSPAFWMRWVVLEFPYVFVGKEELEDVEEKDRWKYKKKDSSIIEKMSSEDELSGLLNWALVGLGRLLKNGDFSYSKSTEDVKNMWLRKSDSFNGFVMDCIEEDYDGKITKNMLRKVYSMYCRYYKLKVTSDKGIKYVLSTTLGVSEERFREEGQQIPYWGGIKFKDNSVFGKVGIDGNGFYCPREFSKFLRKPNTITDHTNLTTTSLNEETPEIEEEKVIDEKTENKKIEEAIKPSERLKEMINDLFMTEKQVPIGKIVDGAKEFMDESDVEQNIERMKRHGSVFVIKPGVIMKG